MVFFFKILLRICFLIFGTHFRDVYNGIIKNNNFLMKRIIIFICFLLFLSENYGQVTIGSGLVPDDNALLDLKQNEDGSSIKGLLFPRVALVSISDPSPLSAHVEGMIVYNIGTSDETVDTRLVVSPGTYYNDGNRWINVSSSDTNPWYSSITSSPATTLSEPIYHIGSVALGATEPDATAQLDITSNTKGVLIPRLSKSERDAMVKPANGLMIFNITTNCLNYYNETNTRWLNLCGGYDPAIITIDCANTLGTSTTLTEGKALNNTNTYSLTMMVLEVGTYEIIVKTTNGYSFSKSGLFTSTGIQTITLEGQGAPIKWGTDQVIVQNNGYELSLSCTLPSVEVDPASIRYTIIPDNYVVNGDYYTKIGLDETNYIEVTLNVTAGGSLSLTSVTENGITFSSGALVLETGIQTIKLFGSGTPINPGVFTGNVITDGTNVIYPSITVTSTKGTFDDPANRCQEILDESSTAESGYYWIRDPQANKYLTYCLMEDEDAWTLVKSVSERNILKEGSAIQNESLSSQGARGIISTKNGVFNEYYFSLPAAVVQTIGTTTSGNASATNPKKYKFVIKEKGHTTVTTATMDDVKTTTLSIFDDAWAKENYWNVTVYYGNPSSDNIYTSTNNITEGKIFGKTLTKPSATNIQYLFDNKPFTYNVPGFYSYVRFYTGFYGGYGYVAPNTAANNVTYTYSGRGDSSDGKTFVYNKYYINDLFGVFLGSEGQLNHHIGTCSNSDDDFGGESFCGTVTGSSFSYWRAHRFNQRPDGEYEGRILQHWVK